MKRDLCNYLWVAVTVGFVIFAAGCQTLQPAGIEMVSLVDHGGGGGSDN